MGRRRLTLHLTRSHSNWFKTKRDIDYKVTGVFYGLQEGSQDWEKNERNWRTVQNQQWPTLFVSVPSEATCMQLSAHLSTALFFVLSSMHDRCPHGHQDDLKDPQKLTSGPNSLSKYLGEKIWLVSLCRFYPVPSAIGQGGRGTQHKHSSWMQLLRLGGQFWNAGVRLGRFHRKSGLNWIDQEPWNPAR